MKSLIKGGSRGHDKFNFDPRLRNGLDSRLVLNIRMGMRTKKSHLHASHEAEIQSAMTFDLHIGHHKVVEGGENNDRRVISIKKGDGPPQLASADALRMHPGTENENG